MFQYAFCKLLETKYGLDNVLIDTSYFSRKNVKKYLENGLQMLSVDFTIASKKDLKRIGVPYNSFQPHHFLHRFVAGMQALFNKKYYFEKNRQFVDVDSILKYSYFDGYWQSWKYLEPVNGIILKDFQPKNGLSSLTKESTERYKRLNSVFVGVRRGDYAKSSKSLKMWGAPSIHYYEEAVRIINEKVENPFFVIFSDDIEWVKDNLNFEILGISKRQIEYRDKSLIFNNFEELFVMASCKHAIISNSTFNFWGAWLIENKEKVVIAPKEWFKNGDQIDIIPPYWIQI